MERADAPSKFARGDVMLERNRVAIGDVRELAGQLEPGSVQTIVTSPPYFALRSYLDNGHADKGKELGSEATPAEYVANLVAVFRALREALKDDGTIWLNLGDSYASGPGGRAGTNGETGTGPKGYRDNLSRGPVGPNIGNALQRSVEGRPLVIGNAPTITIAAHRAGIARKDDGTPQGVLFSLLGIQRVTIKQRDKHFCQVLHALNVPGDCRVTAALCRATVRDADLEIVLDAGQDIRIVIAEHDADVDAVLGIPRVGRRSRKEGETPLAIEQPTEPVAECVADGEAIRDTVALDAPLVRFPDIYLVDQAVTLGDRLGAAPHDAGHFRVAEATPQQLALALGTFGVEIRVGAVAHLYAPNAFGSLVCYSELYDKASRTANTQASKQLLGIPWMVARALQEDGWFLRSDCIWAKPAPMPESVTDRPTRSHEYLFLLAKSPRYFYDQEAIKEPYEMSSWTARSDAAGATLRGQLGQRSGTKGAARAEGAADGQRSGRTAMLNAYANGGRNKRSVWTVNAAQFPDAHYATFPEALIRPCVLAGSRPGDLVLDPFIGSGTTAAVAHALGRDWQGFDLDERALKWTADRLARFPVGMLPGLAG